ncbi:MAG: 3-dehydroquinate synthase [Oscillospiraceae bacterium]|nr:3-dehydroquinate synthase [Oscillospiraceae bacterium]
MIEIAVEASRAYRVLIGSGLLDRAGELSAPLFSGRRALIAAGETVFALYGEKLTDSLKRAGFTVSSCVYPSGEQEKTPETMLKIVSAMADAEMTREDAVFALGGGVTCDMAGLAAALYRRGTGCVLLPTTLLAAADAAVGGKTGVNLPSGKNQLGTISQPLAVLCDTDCFETLPDEQKAEGFAEIVKAAFLQDGALLRLLSDGQTAPEALLAEAVSVKAAFVRRDENDRGDRQLLNFGHTAGHAIERCSGYQWTHGRAVSAGMAVVTRAAVRLGLCDRETLSALESTLSRFDLPLSCPYTAEELLPAVRADKKRGAEGYTLIVPRAVGRCERRIMNEEELLSWLRLGLQTDGSAD